MESPFSYITEQYDAVLDSGQVLFEYCKTISQPDLLMENISFGRGGSIRNLLVHIANTYEFWIAKNALHRNISLISELLREAEKISKIDSTILMN